MAFSWTLRRYRDGDEQAIVELLNSAQVGTAHGKPHSLEYWRWKYAKNPAGSPIISLAECDNRIIGHYGITPVIMKIGNAYVTASCAHDGATHPDHEGRGVFSSVVNRAYLDAGQNAMHVTYGFSDADLGPTYGRYEHLGHICFTKTMIKVLDWEPFLARYIPIEFLTRAAGSALGTIRRSRSSKGDLTIERVTSFDERVDTLWEKVSQNFRVIVRRKHTYLNWRYVAHPDANYTIYAALEGDVVLGYCVLEQRQHKNARLGLLVDVLGVQDRRDVVGCLIDRAVEYSERENLDAVQFRISERHPYAPLFRRAGFITISHRDEALYATINLPGSPLDEKRVFPQALLLSQSHFLKEKANWFMTYGDEF
jgi:hypothetical protein